MTGVKLANGVVGAFIQSGVAAPNTPALPRALQKWSLTARIVVEFRKRSIPQSAIRNPNLWPCLAARTPNFLGRVLLTGRDAPITVAALNMTMRDFNGLLLSCLFALAGTLPASAQSADQSLATFFKAYLEDNFKLRPLEASQLGDHRFDDRLEDVSPESRRAWVDLIRTTLAELPRRVEYAKLTRDGQIDFEIFQQSLERSLWMDANFHPFEDDPRTYNEYINESVFLLLSQSSLPKEVNVSHAIARMAHIPRIVAAARQNLRNPPRVVVETAIRQNQGAINFYEQDIFILIGKTAQLESLRAATQTVLPALRAYQDFLQKDLLPRATGEWRIGKERFAQKLERVLDTGMTANQLLDVAEAEFSRVERDLYVIARQLWGRYGTGQPLPPDDAEGRQLTTHLVLRQVAQEHGRPQDLVKDARATVAKIKKFIAANDLVRLPETDRCQIIEMPEFQRGNSLAYMNSPPPLDSTAAGYYAISPPPKDWDAQRVQSLLEEYNRHMLQILTIHEAYPGHYVQHEYANRVPSLIRKVLGSGVYIEGWAVYTEQTMLDQGYGQGDLALRMNQLKFYQRAVANAILDHKMHCTEMTDDEALKFLTERAHQSEGEAKLKVIRAKQSSVQLSTYFAGRTAMYNLRQQMQRRLGTQFNLGRYHEAVLENGPVPVKYLPELVSTKLGVPLK
ncbi:MAG: DUF885 domain-containing protein [Verrucomicrobiota bacterium]